MTVEQVARRHFQELKTAANRLALLNAVALAAQRPRERRAPVRSVCAMPHVRSMRVRKKPGRHSR